MVYAHIFDMQPMFVNGMCPGKSLKTSLLSPGKPWNLVFAIPGKSWKMGFECLRTMLLVGQTCPPRGQICNWYPVCCQKNCCMSVFWPTVNQTIEYLA